MQNAEQPKDGVERAFTTHIEGIAQQAGLWIGSERAEVFDGLQQLVVPAQLGGDQGAHRVFVDGQAEPVAQTATRARQLTTRIGIAVDVAIDVARDSDGTRQPRRRRCLQQGIEQCIKGRPRADPFEHPRHMTTTQGVFACRAQHPPQRGNHRVAVAHEGGLGRAHRL